MIKMTTIFEIFKMIKMGYLMGKAINSIAKKRSNQMAAISMVWGSVFNSGLKFNWGLRFVPKNVMEGKEGGLEINAPDAIFATIPKLCCVLICLENLKEATKEMSNKEWALYVIQGIAHEYRHAQQIEYFESVGLDSNYSLHYLSFSYMYLTSPIEEDAVQFSCSILISYENGCLKIESKYEPVSEAMHEVAKEIKKQQFIDCIKRA